MGQSSTKHIKTTFHQAHGEDIELGDDDSAAVRVENSTTSRSSGLLFSAEPVKICQKIYIKLLVVSRDSHDVISIGFTSYNPENELKNVAEIERNSWSCSLSKYFCVEDAVVCFFVDNSGVIHYTKTDSVEYKVLNKTVDVSKPLWVLFYIWDEPTTIKSLSQNEVRQSVFRMKDDEEFIDAIEDVPRKAMKDVQVGTDGQEDNDLCIICYVQKSDVVFVPCGHFCTCFQCGQWVNRGDSLCPICRKKIGSVVKVYKS